MAKAKSTIGSAQTGHVKDVHEDFYVERRCNHNEPRDDENGDQRRRPGKRKSDQNREYIRRACPSRRVAPDGQRHVSGMVQSACRHALSSLSRLTEM